jgi:hypothetical protein
LSRAPNAELTDIQWDAIRAAWESGASNRHLAAEFNVDESSIRYRAKKHGWVRDDAAIERIQSRGAARTLQVAAAPGSRTIPHPAGTAGSRPAPADPLTPEERQKLREERVEAAADVIAEANLRALAKTDRLDAIFDQMHGLVADLLSRPAADDEAALRRKSEAANTLLAGRTDSVGGAILALAKLAESVQNQRRKALGADDRPKQVQLTGAGGGPIETASASVVVGAQIDYAKLSTAELEQLMAAASIIEGRKERPPVPVPPGDPEG